MRERIEKLHEAYCGLTGLEVRLSPDRERGWFEWVKEGFTDDDLKIVIFHIKKGIQAGARNAGALKFRNLIGQTDYFEEDLAEAKARGRGQRTENRGRQEVLRESGRPGTEHGKDQGVAAATPYHGKMAAPVPTEPRKVDAIAAEVLEKRMQELKRLRENL